MGDHDEAIKAALMHLAGLVESGAVEVVQIIRERPVKATETAGECEPGPKEVWTIEVRHKD